MRQTACTMCDKDRDEESEIERNKYVCEQWRARAIMTKEWWQRSGDQIRAPVAQDHDRLSNVGENVIEAGPGQMNKLLNKQMCDACVFL